MNDLELNDERSQLPQVVEPSTLAILARAEVDIQISTAHAFPRSITQFKRSALSMATLDRETAQSCFYALPRGGKTVEGPSVRLAEIVGSAWGNLRYGARMVQIGERAVTAQGVCHDLERNVSATVEVQRRITKKNGQRYDDDMIGVACNAACSIALRNAVFKVVPGAYWHEVYVAARKAAIGDAKTLVNQRADMVAYFAKMSVSAERVLAAISKTSLDDVGLDELVTLKGLATAIREGETTVDEAFPAPASKLEPGKSRTDQVAEAVKAKANGANGSHAPAQAPAAPAAQPEAPVSVEASPDEAALADFVADIRGALQEADRSIHIERIRDKVNSPECNWIGAETRKQLLADCEARNQSLRPAKAR